MDGTTPSRRRLALFSWLAATVILVAIGFFLTSYQTDLYRKLILWVTLAIGFNFLFGITGQIALSHFAFYGIGAYSMIILWLNVGIPLPIALVGALVICAVLAFAVAVPTTRLEGFYLALVTLALAQLLIVLLRSGQDVTGGSGGISGYQLPPVLGVEISGPWYTAVIVLLLLATLAIYVRLGNSYFGRACRAVRDNPEAAAAMGINVARTKIIVFTLTSVLAGVAGFAFAFVDNTINPDLFSVENMFMLLFMVIVGGRGRHAGAIVGAALLYLANPLLEPYIGHHTQLAFGLIVVGAILFQRHGLIGLYDQIVAARRPRPTEAAANE
jgi:branched-chain amino acid transport system permease protein